jgi:four helix bundle protein
MVDSDSLGRKRFVANRTINSYRDLIARQKAMDLVVGVYRATESLPRDEVFGLRSQMRRCAVSVPSNIAEGQGRSTKGEFLQFHGHARGSPFELETQTLIAGRFGYINAETIQNLTDAAAEVARIVNGLLTSLGVSSHRGSK